LFFFGADLGEAEFEDEFDEERWPIYGERMKKLEMETKKNPPMK
jgi:hypothetical protein